jgi:hypothetical protein
MRWRSRSWVGCFQIQVVLSDMNRLFLILLGLALIGAGCTSSNDPGFVVSGSSVIIPGSMGGEIQATGAPLSVTPAAGF